MRSLSQAGLPAGTMLVTRQASDLCWHEVLVSPPEPDERLPLMDRLPTPDMPGGGQGRCSSVWYAPDESAILVHFQLDEVQIARWEAVYGRTARGWQHGVRHAAALLERSPSLCAVRHVLQSESALPHRQPAAHRMSSWAWSCMCTAQNFSSEGATHAFQPKRR